MAGFTGLNVTVKTAGGKSVRGELNRVGQKLVKAAMKFDDEVGEIFLDTANDMRNDMIMSMRNTTRASHSYPRGGKRHHPSQKGSPPAIDTGELVSRIAYDISQSGGDMVLEVGVTAGAKNYADLLEDENVLDRPFLKPAVDEHVPKMVDKLRQVGIELITEPLKGLR